MSGIIHEPVSRGPDRRRQPLPTPDSRPANIPERRAGVDRRQFGFISRLELFESIPFEAVEGVLSRSEIREADSGELLLSPGDVNNSVHILVSGALQIHLERPDSQDFIELGEGSCFGELSLIDGRPASAYVIAAQPSKILVIEQNSFWNHLILQPGVARNLLRVLSERIRQNNEIILSRLKDKLALETLQKELLVARNIQQSMLPPAEELSSDITGIEAFAVMEAAKDVGGDFYDAFSPASGKLFVAIGDVSGKGMPAALFMARAITQLRMEAVRKRSPSSILEAANRALCRGNDAGMFVTLFCGILDVESGAFTYASAGHNPPFTVDANGSCSPLPVKPGLVAGIIEDTRYPQDSVMLGQGRTLLLYTDGVTEAMNPDNACFGEHRLIECLRQFHLAAPRDLVAAIQSCVSHFAGSAPQADDITLLAIRRSASG